MDAIFTSEKLDKLDELANAINNLRINDAGYELNKAIVIDAQDDITSNPYTVTHTINRILYQNLLSCGTIRKFSI